jgi:hypothetical protein
MQITRAQAQTATGGAETTITEQEAHAIGVDAYLYFYPLVTMDLTRKQLTNVEPGKGWVSGIVFTGNEGLTSSTKGSGEAVSKTEGEAAATAPSNYSRGEGQKSVTTAYRENWNAIYSKKNAKKKKR